MNVLNAGFKLTETLMGLSTDSAFHLSRPQFFVEDGQFFDPELNRFDLITDK